jgi:uncharacterized radical SAM protein YgiQ
MKPQSPLSHLPISGQECRSLGWKYVDIVLVTGDAYIDHPSFGIALIGRLLQSHGYRVAILPQPRYDSPDDFRQFGRPRLFFGITSGNLDSIVANYSGNGKVRMHDAYSPSGNPWFGPEHGKSNRRRPDRATSIYANLARAAFKDIPVVLGGIEASLRRFIHYDYKQDRLRGSVLTDAKADLLLYGMGEKSIIETAQRIADGHSLSAIAGTCRRLNDAEMAELFAHATHSGPKQGLQVLPSWDDIAGNRDAFMEAERAIDLHARACSQDILAQRQQTAWLVQYPAPTPLTSEELDRLYELPFSRKPHPAAPDIPAYEMIRHSITIVRGCSGNCSFCAIARHQGPVVSSRSQGSILKEAARITDMDDFSGTISDLGGPTANLYQTSCAVKTCKKHDCLYPTVCRNLRVDEHALAELLHKVAALEKVRHVFISSGLRMELLLRTPMLLEALIMRHLPGAMKIAPEHTEDEILTLMHKESHQKLCTFLAECRKAAKKAGKEIHFTPYIITAHPGCMAEHCTAMIKKLARLGLQIRQFQDFTPTPGTLSTAMYVTGLHRDTDRRIFIPRNQSDKTRQRQILEGKPTARQKKAKRP